MGLVDAGIDRQAAYKLVQRHALESWDSGGSFRAALASDPTVRERLTEEELEALFDPADQLAQVDEIFARLGLLAPSRVEVPA